MTSSLIKDPLQVRTCLEVATGISQFLLLVISKRPMAPGIPVIEGSTHGHDVIPVKAALEYFKRRGSPDYSIIYNEIKAAASPYLYSGSTKDVGANRVVFGEAVNLVLDGLSKEEAANKVMVIDSELSDIKMIF